MTDTPTCRARCYDMFGATTSDARFSSVESARLLSDVSTTNCSDVCNVVGSGAPLARVLVAGNTTYDLANPTGNTVVGNAFILDLDTILPFGGITPATAGSASTGASFEIRAQDSTSANAGDFFASGGNVTTGAGGDVGLLGGSALNVGGFAGNAFVNAGNAVSQQGGGASLAAGSSTSANGGTAAVLGGTTTSGSGGNVNVIAGITSTGVTGGNLTLAGGELSNNVAGTGGRVSLVGGTTALAGTGGLVIVAGGFRSSRGSRRRGEHFWWRRCYRCSRYVPCSRKCSSARWLRNSHVTE
jgi:hypothetical protein